MSENLAANFFIGFDGKFATDDLKLFIKEHKIGGIILFKRNFESKKQVKDLISEIKSLKKGMLLSVDHEGGVVQRFRGEGFTELPPILEIRTEEEAQGHGEVIGRELKSVGIDIDFAPVLDVLSYRDNPVIKGRAFSSDPKEVASLGVAHIKGMMDEKIIPCGKHFPGHGDSRVDSHKDLPYIEADPKVLHDRELIPFKAAIEFGLPMIMTAHLMVESLDEMEPATTSRVITTELLRGMLGFKGVVITDDLSMGGILKRYPTDEAAWRAIAAGADIALICDPDFDLQHLAIKRAIHALELKDLSQTELEKSINRILGLRCK